MPFEIVYRTEGDYFVLVDFDYSKLVDHKLNRVLPTANDLASLLPVSWFNLQRQKFTLRMKNL